MAVINTNLMSLNAQRNLSVTQSALATSVQRLSTGLRVNSAKDDAAGLAIAERMNTQVRGMNVAIRNENRRQEAHIELIASENYTSPAVMEAQRAGSTWASVLPTMQRAATLASCTPVALETKGTVREARGFTSST